MPTPDFSKVWASNSPLPEYTFTDSDYITGWDFVGSAPPTKNEFDAWFRATDEKLNYLYSQLQDTASKLYPIGSVYISFNSADPSTLFGGTWQRLKDTFLLVNGDSYAPNTTGGSATKTIAVSNMPSHNHTVNNAGNHTHTATTSTNGNHTHTRGNMNITGTFAGGIDKNNSWSGAFYKISGIKGMGDADGTHYKTGFDAARNNGAYWTGSTSSNGAHTHTLTTSTNGNHTHTVTNTGGGVPLNIMPPYTTVYAWRRTA